VDNGYGYDFIPVTGNGYELEYMKKVTGTDVQCYYLRIVYSLPSLSPPLPLGANKNQPGWNQDVTIVAEIRTDWIRKQGILTLTELLIISSKEKTECAYYAR
jgi:hypothetical protein